MAAPTDRDEETWEDWEADEAAAPAQCLLCPARLPGPECHAHMAEAHALDLKATAQRLGLDQYGAIKLINFLRAQTAAGAPAPAAFVAPGVADFDDEKWLRPVLADDALLVEDYGLGFGDDSDDDSGDDAAAAEPRAGAAVGGPATVEQLQRELARVTAAFAAYRATAEPVLLGGLTANALMGAAGGAAPAANDSDTDSDSEADSDAEEAKVLDAQLDGYFASYSHYGIHEQMLKDQVRTDGYRDAIVGNPNLFKDKVVLDIGCGTSILSIFAARAGAAKVIGIDNSGIVTKARRIVAENGLSDKITLVRGKVEELESLPGVDKVDIIISEWMGYFLFYESMLDTVLYARDKWLAPGGTVLPDQAGLYLVALDYTQRYADHIRFWEDVYGVDMRCVQREVFDEPLIEIVDPTQVMSAPHTLKNSDMGRMQPADVDLDRHPFQLVAQRAGTCHALCVYFDILFEANCDRATMFCTGPKATPTHWQQTVFFLTAPLEVGAGDLITGHLSYHRNARNPRHLDIRLEYRAGDAGELHRQAFLLA